MIYVAVTTKWDEDFVDLSLLPLRVSITQEIMYYVNIGSDIRPIQNLTST